MFSLRSQLLIVNERMVNERDHAWPTAVTGLSLEEVQEMFKARTKMRSEQRLQP